MGERNDLPSWGGYTLSEIESIRNSSNSDSRPFVPKSNDNPDCPPMRQISLDMLLEINFQIQQKIRLIHLMGYIHRKIYICTTTIQL